MTIKAIETRYRDILFRSRLEARWAVFFDALGLPWEYEREGYALPSGSYLPDFWLTVPFHAPGHRNAWVEVKGVYPTPLELSLASELADGTSQRVVILHGSLQLNRHGCFWGCVLLIPEWVRDRRDPLDCSLEEAIPGISFPDDRAFLSAFRRARSARFEYGEAP